MIKILWLQDFDPLASGGGAQITDKLMIFEGVKRGYEINVATPQTLNKAGVERCDFVVLSNCVTFQRDDLNFIIKTKKYATFNHDYWFCRWRGYFPLQAKCFNCKRIWFWRNVFLNSELNIFLSPLHFEVHAKVIPGLEEHPHFKVPSPIEDFFKPVEGVERRRNAVLWVGPFTEYKGIKEALSYAKVKVDKNYTFIGADVDGIERGWREIIELMGFKVKPPIPRDFMPEVYSRFEYFLELPPQPLPFERVVAEAYLCGCKLIVNKNVGFVSWRFANREEARKAIKKSPERFWREIEKCI